MDDREAKTQRVIRISKDHRAIYITSKTVGKLSTLRTPDWLKPDRFPNQKKRARIIGHVLHNNSRWAIRIPTWSLYLGKKVSLFRLSDGGSVLGLSDGMEVNARYSVVEDDGWFVRYGRYSYSESWLPPGRSVIFSVSREHLSKGRSIYIYFNYEWEREEKYSNNLPAEHRSMYWVYRLQEDAK